MESCPDATVWAAWSGSAAECARWDPHLAACASCRAELASLVAAVPELPSSVLKARWLDPLPVASRRRMPLAAAAAFLLLAGGGWAWRVGRQPLKERVPSHRPEGRPAPAAWAAGTGPIGCEVPTEALVGPSGELSLDRGALAEVARDADGTPVVLWRQGLGWIETGGELLRVRLEECADGTWEIRDGVLGLRVGGASPRAKGLGSLLSSACAAEEGHWAVTLIRGEAAWVSDGSRHVLAPGETMGTSSEAVPADPRVWRSLPGVLPSVREGVLSLADPGAPSYVAEVLVRKRDRTAEAALLFSAAGRGWQLPLGSQLPSDPVWTRLRVEIGGGRIRLLAGSKELLSEPEAGLALKAYPSPEHLPWGLRVWGGDLEIKESRWRTSAP